MASTMEGRERMEWNGKKEVIGSGGKIVSRSKESTTSQKDLRKVGKMEGQTMTEPQAEQLMMSAQIRIVTDR